MVLIIDSNKLKIYILALIFVIFISKGLWAQHAYGSAISDVGNVASLQNNSFQIGDINLSSGTVCFTEKDLYLPGKNGLNLSISRLYNSRYYNSYSDIDPTTEKRWSGWTCGAGWRFSFGSRAYVVRCKDNSKNKIIIENATGSIDEYKYNPSTNKYYSVRPGNFKKVELGYTWSFPRPPIPGRLSPAVVHVDAPFAGFVTVTMENGLKYTYRENFFFESHRDKYHPDNDNPFNRDKTTLVLDITGFYLTSITDTLGNNIYFNYELSPSYDHINAGTSEKKVAYLVGNVYDYLDDYTFHSDHLKVTFVVSYRISDIVDTYGRKVNINYDHPRNQCATNKEFIVTDINYKNANGITNEIKYAYNSKGHLISTQLNNLPFTLYEYTKYTPNFHMYYSSTRQSPDNPIELVEVYEVLYEDDPFTKDTTKKLNDEFWRIKTFEGHLLSSVIEKLGSVRQYSYRYNLSAISVEEHGIPVYNRMRRGVLAKLAHPGGTYLIVTKKKLIETFLGGKTFIYNFKYPKTSFGQPVMSRYTPKDSEAKVFYFPSVTIDNPSQIADEIYDFNQGLSVNRRNGAKEIKTEWDFDKMRKTKVTIKKSGETQSITEYQSYDSYNNPLKIVTTKGSSPYVSKENTYYTDSVFINKNLLHLHKTTRTKDLTTSQENQHYFSYYDNGKIKDIYEGLNSSGKHKSYNEYDSHGRQTKTVLYNGSVGNQVINYSYTGGDNYTALKTTKTINGKSSNAEYNPYLGILSNQTDSNGNKTGFSYDGYGRLIKTTYPDNSYKTISYGSNLKSTYITYAGRTEKRYLDNFGRLKYIDRPEGEEDTRLDYYYSNKIEKIYQGNYPSNWTPKKTYFYDLYLRKTSIVDSNFGTTSYSYDDSANKISITDAKNRTLVKSLDKIGRITQEIYQPNGSSTHFSYNAYGQITQTIDPGNVYHNVYYDSYGKLLSSNHPGSGTNSGKVYAQHVYLDNDLLSRTVIKNENGSEFKRYNYVYDNENRLINIKENNLIKETLTYDTGASNGKNKLTIAENDQIKTKYDYDNMGRVSKETTTLKNLNQKHAIQTQYTPFSAYDTITYNDGKKIKYTYDPNLRVRTMSYNNKRLATYGYNANGTIQSISLGNGWVVHYTYTKDILVASIRVNNKSGAEVYNQNYQYDTLGNITKTSYQNPLNNKTISKVFRYTVKDELKEVDLNDKYNYYTYQYQGHNGNATVFSLADQNGSVTTQRTFNFTKNQLTKQAYPDQRELTFSYDTNGNMLNKVRKYRDSRPDKKIDYIYNYQDQVEEVKENNTTIAKYAYNHNRQRVYSYTTDTSLGGGHKYYYWDTSGRIIGEGHAELGDHIVRYFYSGNEKIAMARPDWQGGEKIYYFINNLQGTPVYIIDEAENKVSKILMDEWGNLPTNYVVNKKEINYTGKKLDENTNLYYFNQRYYDPEIGRFITHDPARQRINPYAYCASNPLAYVDPDGEFFRELFGSVVPVFGHFVGAALDSYIANVATQWVSNGFDASKINWGQANNALTNGGLSYGLDQMNLKFDLGEGFLMDGIDHSLNNGVSNMVRGGSFSEGLMQGSRDYIAERIMAGASPAIHEYDYLFNDLKGLIPDRFGGIVVGRSLPFGFEHWQIITKGINFGDFGIRGKGNPFFVTADVGSEANLAVNKNWRYRVVGYIKYYSKTKLNNSASPWYNIALNNCVHGAKSQNIKFFK